MYESIRNILSTYGLPTKESAIQTLKGLSRTIKVSKRDIDLACRVLLNMDTGDGTVLGMAFVFDVFGEVFVPAMFGFSVGREKQEKLTVSKSSNRTV